LILNNKFENTSCWSRTPIVAICNHVPYAAAISAVGGRKSLMLPKTTEVLQNATIGMNPISGR
jgi:hypothetical protein